MQISSRFTIAIHILLVIALEGDSRLTSKIIAGSVGVNPVIIRKILSQLKKAGLISVARGTGGAQLTRFTRELTLLEVYQAVECLGTQGQLFRFHDNPNPACDIGRNIHGVLDGKLDVAQAAMEEELSRTSLADLIKEAETRIQVDVV